MYIFTLISEGNLLVARNGGTGIGVTGAERVSKFSFFHHFSKEKSVNFLKKISAKSGL